MSHSWLTLLDRVLRPARPKLEACLAGRERHLEQLQLSAEERARALAKCKERIEAERARVFAAGDGVIGPTMSDLEREWRRLSHPDPEAGLMTLWTQIAPSSWLDRKRWRDADPSRWRDAAVALAADPEGVEGAERAAESLVAALQAQRSPLPVRVRWRFGAQDVALAAPLLRTALESALDGCRAQERTSILERARRLEGHVFEAALTRWPERAHLATDLGSAACLDFVWNAAALARSANPVVALRALWATGYTFTALDPTSITLEIPEL